MVVLGLWDDFSDSGHVEAEWWRGGWGCVVMMMVHGGCFEV